MLQLSREPRASGAGAPSVRLRMLGGFDLTSAEEAALKLPTRKICLLLAYLATPTGQSHSREKLAELFWGDTQDEQARGSLRRALTALRTTLGPDALAIDHGAVAMRPGALDLDTEWLALAAQSGSADEGVDIETIYRGEFLAGYSLGNEAFSDWLLFERTRHRNLAQTVLERSIERLREQGQATLAVARAQRLVALDPLREQSHRLLISLYRATGERSKAVEQVQHLKRMLAHELGVEPSSQTMALAREITEGGADEAIVAGAAAPAAAQGSGKTQVGEQPARHASVVAVLPFANASGDREQEYFADGITEDVIAALSKIPGLLVIARNSSFAHRGSRASVAELAGKLGARYLVEGSIRRSGDRVRITAMLVDASAGLHLWAERFDRDLSDIFAVQDEVAAHIAWIVAGRLRRPDQPALSTHTANITAYDCFLRGRELHHRLTEETSSQARQLFERALELDPGFAPAHAYLGLTHSIDFVNAWSADPDASLALLHSHALKSVELDPGYAHGHWGLAAAALLMRQHDEAIAHSRRALWCDPNFAEGYSYSSYILHYSGLFEEALAQLDKAMLLDPEYPDMVLHLQAQSLAQLERFDDAIATLNRRLVRRPDTDISRVLLASCYGHLGRHEEAQSAWQAALHANPGYSLDYRYAKLPYRDPAHLEHFMAGLRKAGLRA